MELHLESHHYVRRMPDWRAVVIAGLIAGAMYMVLELLTARFVLYQGAWGTVKMVAALMLGREALASADGFSWTIVLAAGIVHFGLSIVMAGVLAMIVSSFRFDSSFVMASAVGIVFGLVAYFVNFYVFGRYFNWFDEARGWESLFAHALFGLVAADAYMHFERRMEAVPASPRG
ncbi:hypothetical protein SAMN05216345_101491 [Cupriavidus sp. YR651]|uniref:hypothetical protein n=1 Tax=Cupriavidus sp. YR651 TaxID=1855315 RepID=UPI00087FC0C0|nr:hypothetical protein [Cupriavidus sp. YR651]SDC08859.1 hypothetical protein SAMN05216345_101491 [Cupriavidus sp. YR651]